MVVPGEAGHTAAHMQVCPEDKFLELEKGVQVRDSGRCCVSVYLCVTHFGIILDVQKSCKDNTELPYTPDDTVVFIYTHRKALHSQLHVLLCSFNFGEKNTHDFCCYFLLSSFTLNSLIHLNLFWYMISSLGSGIT